MIDSNTYIANPELRVGFGGVKTSLSCQEAKHTPPNYINHARREYVLAVPRGFVLACVTRGPPHPAPVAVPPYNSRRRRFLRSTSDGS